MFNILFILYSSKREKFFNSSQSFTMLFDFPAFIEELREKEDKKDIVEKYEKYFWKIVWDIKDQIRYKDYLAQFPTQSYLTPEDLEDDFDRDILEKLVIGSFSSDYELKQEDKDWWRELYIAVKSWDQSIVKTVSELWSFQILRLYEIYIEEQMNLQILMNEDESEDWEWEKEALISERQVRLKKWNAVLDTLNRSKEAEDAKRDQEAALWDLMWKL